jgi:hypothetical protein
MDLGIRRATSAHPSGCQAKLAAAVPPTTTTVRTSRQKVAQFTFRHLLKWGQISRNDGNQTPRFLKKFVSRSSL